MRSGNFTGIAGIPNQDMAMWVTMGGIVDRTHDRLGASDMAIVAFRQQMVAAAKSFALGAPAIGVGSQAISKDVCAFQAIISKQIDWREHLAKPI